MIELFQNLSEETKNMITSYIDIALINADPQKIPNLINDFVKIMPTEEMANFADFYFRLKMEELRNGDNNNQR